MLDTRSLLFGITVLIGLGLVGAIIVLASRRERNTAVSPNPLGQRLAMLGNQRPDYRIVVGVPPQEPASWALVSQIDGDRLLIEGHDAIALTP